VLHCEKWGKGDPVVLVHGFTQTGRSWGDLGRRLGAIHAVNAVDAPGHGGSGHIAAGLWDGAALIGEAGGTATYVGYSMGGRFALHLALRRPDLATRLVLISTSAGIDDAAERAERLVADEALARKIEREGVEAFVGWWLRRPMWATLPEEAAGIGQRLSNSAAGLASSLRLAGAGRIDPPLWGRLGELAMPVLILAGELDSAYAGRAARFGAAIRRATVAIVPGAGHACHLERPDAVWEIVEPWLATEP
jgi:2-succinyl-6-hydroxy-2,4-cyclohexadiene-1-carboxylate synthase